MSSAVPFDDARGLLTAAALIDPALIEWPNEAFTAPTGDPPGLWLSVDCVGNMLDPIELGGGVWQESGTLYVWVVAPANTGSDNARNLAKAVANTFRNLGPRLVIYRGGSIGQGRQHDDAGLWWSLPVSIDWIYQDTSAT